MHISSTFDSGNIEVIRCEPGRADLRIRRDEGGEHMQWFHFRLAGAAGLPCDLRILNAAKASYPKAWTGYRACVTEDRERWTRVDTRYEDGVLILQDTPRADLVWYSYFAPYSLERLADLLALVQESEHARVERLGATVDGRDLDRVIVGEQALDRPTLWVIARQHPGETMASWWMEGFLGRLLDPDDALARRVRSEAVLHIVPHMNPDGGVRGHLRCNAAGRNLNREWDEPSRIASPEVALVRDAMDGTGVDFCLDVHGDEELPYNFLSGAEGVPGWSRRLAKLDQRFRQAFVLANPDFQTTRGYPIDAPGTANLSMCTNQVCQRFSSLAFTLEMPFKDNADLPDPIHGWSPERCQRLGASTLDPIAQLLGDLRAD